MAQRRQQLMGAIAQAIGHLQAQGRTTARVHEILAALEELGIASALQITEAHLNALGDAAGKAGLGLEKRGRKGYVIPAVIPNRPAPEATSAPAPPEPGPAAAGDVTGGTGAGAESIADTPAEAGEVTLEFVQHGPPELETGKAGPEAARAAADPAAIIC
jgi:hypothetical protein